MTTIQDFILYLGIQISDEERLKSLPTAIKMVNLAKKVRFEGILSLEDEVVEDNDFMKMGANLVLEGVEVDTIEKILQNSILSGGYTKTDLLDRLIMTQGLIAIVNYYSPFVIANIVGSILGEKYISEIIDTINKAIDVNDFIDKYTLPLYESIDFEKRLLKLTRTELSRLLMSIDNGSLTTAFGGCSKSFINKMREGISVNSFTEVCEAFSHLKAPREENSKLMYFKELVLEHQSIILCELEELENLGIIIKRNN
jgi:hypothetical protein